MRQTILVLVLIVSANADSGAQSVRLAQSAPPRVEMNEALRQIIKMVEPVVPAPAAAAKIGGTVVTEAVIRVDGTVESVRILAGPQPLHQAAIDAVKQWTFKPFLRNGKPARVMALLDVKFPNPAGDEARSRNQAVFAAIRDCSAQQQNESAAAEAACAQAARLADENEPRELVLRGSAHATLATVLLRARKTSAALAEFEIALSLRLQDDPDENDADVAEMLALIGVAQMALGETAAADTSLSRATKAFEGAVTRVPSLRDNYMRRFASVLQVHARLKRTMGQTEAAAAMERRAADMSSAPPPPAPPPPRPAQPPTLRMLANLQCLCSPDVDDAKMKSTLVSVPAAFRPWLAESGFGDIQFYGAATSTGADYRIGPVSMLGPRGSPTDPNAPPMFGALGSWIQLPAPPAGLGLTSRNSPGWPVLASWHIDQSPLVPADFAGLVRFMRSDAAKSVPPGNTPIQPWRIAEISHRGSLDFAVVLVDPSFDMRWPYPPGAPGLQTVTVRKSAGRWIVLKIEGR